VTEIIDASKFSGRPMEITALLDTDPMLAHLPSDAVILTIEGARESLPLASKLLIDLQVMNDEAHDLCEELEVLLETLNPNHEHVSEIAEYLAKLVSQWQQTAKNLESTGTRVACLEPGRLEWYGVIDGNLALFSWALGEEDIEWYHAVDAGFNARKPLIEA
tara:strand:+ start:3066 stop:3551 length:486 start_codon:yes stop_codon:yes gene_type:complete